MGGSDEKTGEPLVVISGGHGDGGDAQAESFGSRVSVCSSTSILMGDDDHDEAESSLMVADPTKQQGEHQLDDLSPLLESLTVRSGLSEYYKEKSQSFTDLSLVKRLQDLPKKTTTYNTRMKARRGQASAGPSAGRSSISCHRVGPCSKIIAKKAMPKGKREVRSSISSERLLSRARNSKNHLRMNMKARERS